MKQPPPKVKVSERNKYRRGFLVVDEVSADHTAQTGRRGETYSCGCWLSRGTGEPRRVHQVSAVLVKGFSLKYPHDTLPHITPSAEEVDELFLTSALGMERSYNVARKCF